MRPAVRSRGGRVDAGARGKQSVHAMPHRIASIEERLRKTLGDGLLTDEPMRLHTTFRIGGPADYFFHATTPDQVVAALRSAHELGLPVFLLGGGSNLLVS